MWISTSVSQVSRKAAEKSSFPQRHIVSNIYNDEEHYGRQQPGRELEQHTTILTVIHEFEEECELR